MPGAKKSKRTPVIMGTGAWSAYNKGYEDGYRRCRKKKDLRIELLYAIVATLVIAVITLGILYFLTV